MVIGSVGYNPKIFHLFTNHLLTSRDIQEPKSYNVPLEVSKRLGSVGDVTPLYTIYKYPKAPDPSYGNTNDPPNS